MEVQCEYQLGQLDNDFKSKYLCTVKNVNIVAANTRITKFIGNHVNGKSVADVDELVFLNTTVEHIPCGLNIIFPQLNVLRIENCGLKAICQKDLLGLENLTTLKLPSNQLTSLPSNLFTKMENLRKVSFKCNKLKYLQLDLLKPMIEKAHEIDLRENTSVCYYGTESLYYSREKSQVMFYQSINSNFEKPIEDEINGKFVENLTKGIKQLWSSNQHSDFTVTVGKKKFSVHKNILCVQSSVFAAIFDIDMKEKQQSELIIEDFSADSVEEFLRFIYTGIIPDDTNAMELFALSSKYDIQALKSYWEKIIIKNIDETNALEIFTLGHLHDSEEMKKLAFKEIKKLFPSKKLPDDLIDDPERLKEIVEAGVTLKRKIQEAEDEFNAVYERNCKRLKQV